jgi:hypothetical protein
MPVRRATGQLLRGYSTSMKSTEQVPDAHRALPWCFTTSPRSGATSPGTGPGYNRTQAVKRLHLDHTLTGRPEQRHGPDARRRAGPGHNPGGLPRLSVGKANGPAIGTAELTRIGSGNSRMRGIRESVVMSKMLLRTTGSRTRVKVTAAYGPGFFVIRSSTRPGHRRPRIGEPRENNSPAVPYPAPPTAARIISPLIKRVSH